LYKKLKPYGDYGGIYFFGNPIFIVLNPEFAKTILVRDFHYFMDRGIYFNEHVDKLSANIFFLRGKKWKNLREKLSPTFSTSKLKQMFSTIHVVAERLDAHLQPYADQNADIDVREIFARFTTDVIASCAFGLDIDSLNNPQSEFRAMGKKIINFTKMKALKLIFASTFQNLAMKLGIRWNDVDVSDFFMKVVRDTIDYRMSNSIVRNDFMQILIEMMEREELTFEDVAAQAFIFFFGG
jgi:cytochrome P450 family 6